MSPPHVKTNKMAVRPAKTQISLGIRPVWSESLLSAWRKLGSLATHWAQRRLWSDWADAQADLSLRWAQSHFVGFVMSRLILCWSYFWISIWSTGCPKKHVTFLFAFTAAGVVQSGGCKMSPRSSIIVQFIFYFWSFEISENILRNQK